MISQEFTASALNKLRRRGSQFKYRTDAGTFPNSQSDWDAFLSTLQSEVLSGAFRFRNLKSKKPKSGKPMFSTGSLENIIVMRKINDNIRRAYRIKQASRFDVIRQVQQALREATPKHVIRVDIRSFYESVPKRVLLDRLRADRLISTRTLELLRQLLRHTGHLGARGLPRGLQISATLAELHASQLERDLRAIPGVYYVARYVDDVVVFARVDATDVLGRVEQAFALHKLRINHSKSQDVHIRCRCEPECNHGNSCQCIQRCKCAPILKSGNIKHIDLLGYRIAFPDVNSADKKDPNDVRTYLADKKVAKIKSRIHAAISDFRVTGDDLMLRDRVLFLTGNYRLPSDREGGALAGGIYYNYDLYRPYDDPSILCENRFEHLDVTLRSALLSSLAGNTTLSRVQRRRLISMSFKNGHLHRRMRNLEPKRIADIGRCWYET